MRSRLSELASLLYNTAASVNTWAATGQQLHRGLNPTPGAKLVYRSHLMDRGDGRPLPEVRGQRNASTTSTPHSATSSHEQSANNSNINISNKILQAQTNNNTNSHSNSNSNSYAPNQPFLGASVGTTFTDVPVQQAFEATGFMDSANNLNSATTMDFLGPVEGVYDAINFPEGILDFYGWGRFFEGNNSTGDPSSSAQGGIPNNLSSDGNGFSGLQDPNNGGL